MIVPGFGPACLCVVVLGVFMCMWVCERVCVSGSLSEFECVCLTMFVSGCV